MKRKTCFNYHGTFTSSIALFSKHLLIIYKAYAHCEKYNGQPFCGLVFAF